MQRRDFLKSTVAVAAAAELAMRRAQADVPAHNWGKYDFGSGPQVSDRLNQGPFPQYPPDALIPTDEVVIKGGEGSLVNLQMGTDGAWTETGQRTVDGLTFDVYHNAAMDASNTLGDVLVQHGLHVQQN